MYHFNGTAWVRVSPPSSSKNAPSTNFHGVNSSILPVAHCSFRSPSSTTSNILEGDKDQQCELRQGRRAPLKQLFPRTPTPFKKAYAAAVQKGGEVEQLDLQKSPELFEDLKEIILKDVILPPPKRPRRTVRYEEVDSSAGTSGFSVHRASNSEDGILDTSSTPSKVLNDSSFLMSPPFKATICGEVGSSAKSARRQCYDTFEEPSVQPRMMSAEWLRIACGRTPVQIEMTERAKWFLHGITEERRQSK